jgi:hypothetical protein
LSPVNPSDEIPEPVRRLLLERVTDFEELEVLLHFLRHPDARSTVRDVADEVRLSRDVVARSVAALCARELLARLDDGSAYQYRPGTPELASSCEALRQLHNEDRFAIVKLMGRLAIERLRQSAPKAFANAFRIRKPPSGGDSDA